MINQSKLKWVVIGSAAFIMIPALCLIIVYPFLPDNILKIVHILKDNYTYVILAILAGTFLIYFVVGAFFRHVLKPLHQLAEEVALIGIVNSKYRLKTEDRGIFGKLVRSINAIAVRFEAMQKYDQERINRIKLESRKESKILASIITGLPEGILICNAQGKILLYNPRVKKYFSKARKDQDQDAASSVDPFVGLGRFIHDIIDKNMIAHALDEITCKLENREKNVVSAFVSVSTDNELLRVEMVPIMDERQRLAGYILFFQDITYHMRASDQADLFYKSLMREIRSSSAGIRATIEAILAYPEMDVQQLNRFREIIHEESIVLGSIMDKMMMNGKDIQKTEWPLARMNTTNLFGIIKTRTKAKLGIDLKTTIEEPAPFIKADAYSLITVFIFLLEKIRKETGPIEFQVKVHQKNRFVYFDLFWEGRSVKIEMLRKWETLTVSVQGDILPFTLKNVIGQHGAEICVFSEPGIRSNSCLRFFLPACQDFAEERTRELSVFPSSRPEFFDFDLFRDNNVHLAWIDQSLIDLSYTVFDTETTGLDPAGGDEIISIGAVRIVNGRILREEHFDQLIDPNRSISKSSIRIHNIQPEDLKGKPGIESVLPRFQRFVSDTVLVAHNAAFDMRMLQVKEVSTGVAFHNPVLDTLLLSAVIHPMQTNHNLEAISERLGVTLVGRHTAMGDAVTTGNLFLKMIPLLNEKGIFTLREAMEASKKTFYARIKY